MNEPSMIRAPPKRIVQSMLRRPKKMKRHRSVKSGYEISAKDAYVAEVVLMANIVKTQPNVGASTAVSTMAALLFDSKNAKDKASPLSLIKTNITTTPIVALNAMYVLRFVSLRAFSVKAKAMP